MGKKKAPQEPTFQASEIWSGGKAIGRTYRDPATGVIRTEYIQSPEELQAQREAEARQREIERIQYEQLQAQIARQKQYAIDADAEQKVYDAEMTKRRQAQDAYENQINTFTQSMNTLSPEFQKEMDDYSKTLMQQSQNAFVDQYNPVVRNLREESSRRFGTTQNSFYQDEMDRLNKIQADSLKDIAQQATLSKQGLIDTELNRRKNYLSSLQGNLGSIRQGMGTAQNALNQKLQMLQSGTGQVSSTANNVYGLNADELNAFNNMRNLAYNQSTTASEMGNNFNTNIWQGKLQQYIAEQQRRGLGSNLSSMFGSAMRFL